LKTTDGDACNDYSIPKYNREDCECAAMHLIENKCLTTLRMRSGERGRGAGLYTFYLRDLRSTVVLAPLRAAAGSVRVKGVAVVGTALQRVAGAAQVEKKPVAFRGQRRPRTEDANLQPVIIQL
jgi:hypothetical protein